MIPGRFLKEQKFHERGETRYTETGLGDLGPTLMRCAKSRLFCGMAWKGEGGGAMGRGCFLVIKIVTSSKVGCENMSPQEDAETDTV